MYGISMDIGTSGLRAHALDLKDGTIMSTAITDRHPLPGGNVMDHLTFCVNMGVELAHNIVMSAANRLIAQLGIDLGKVERVTVCGNPIQLSVFEGIEVRDLALAGENARRVHGIKLQDRNAHTVDACEVGLQVGEGAELLIPPAIKHEIGADALAMLYKSGFLEQKKICMVTDYGTNAEMALKVGDEIYTGSAAAGPAIEGQHIRHGRLASPGAISDLEYEFHWRCKVLDENLLPQDGDKIDLATGTIIEEGDMHGKAKGITGTGVIALVSAAMENNLFRRPNIVTTTGYLKLQDGIVVDNHDVQEACKAFGAMRAGHFTLIEHAGISFADLDRMYMCGASGTYVDAIKARDVGLLPPSAKNIEQIGNTSLALATDLVRDPELLDELQAVANEIRANHVMFATDKVFETIYIQELAYWEEGMSIEKYNDNLREEGIQPLPGFQKSPNVERKVERDIPVLGAGGLRIVKDTGMILQGHFEGCTRCRQCEKECPENVLTVGEGKPPLITIKTSGCLGTACYRCQLRCPEKVFDYSALELKEYGG
ncbi:MAG TPA: methylamine methyltransferase corrinoid protein reductive activase [Candidatus Methanomethylophilaceae archaeon]|nr:hypothetical protein [Candidatus Methanomethylophilaceae archaeon]HIJ01001.1 methylamine methyltransferase corrinoid protein reductive activase [Candidatus Methanomethylophilaceae archaeon]